MNGYYENKDYGSLSEKVYRFLRDGIAEGRYQTGDCMVEMKIAEELGVSRTPVREALKQLELEDLVSSHPNRGVVVKGLSSEDLQDVSTIRHLLEGQAAFWAAQRVSDTQLSELREVVELMEFYTAKSDVAHLVALDTRFHELIYEASGSRTIRHILASLHHNIRKARQSSLTLPDRALYSLAEHKRIFQAIERKDAPAAQGHRLGPGARLVHRQDLRIGDDRFWLHLPASSWCKYSGVRDAPGVSPGRPALP